MGCSGGGGVLGRALGLVVGMGGFGEGFEGGWGWVEEMEILKVWGCVLVS